MSIIKNNSLIKILLLSFLIILIYLIMTNKDINTYGKVEIQHGDTLWTLAEKYKGSLSTKEWIEIVKKENNLKDDTIIVGQYLSIPISTEVIIANNNHEEETIYVKIASNEQ